jgi:hypothetical protein
MSGFCLGERGLGRGQKLTRAGGPNAHVRFSSAFPACPPAKSAAARQAGGRLRMMCVYQESDRVANSRVDSAI